MIEGSPTSPVGPPQKSSALAASPSDYRVTFTVPTSPPACLLVTPKVDPPACASNAALFDDFVSPLEHVRRNDHADFSRDRQVDGQHASRDYLNRQIGGFCTSEHLVCNDRETCKTIKNTRPVGDETTCIHTAARKDGGNAAGSGDLRNPLPVDKRSWYFQYQDNLDALLFH